MELFRLLGTIAIDNSDANRALNETSSNASDTANTVKRSNDTIRNNNNSTGSSWSSLKSKVAEYKSQGMSTSQAWRQASQDMRSSTESSSGGMVSALKRVGEVVITALAVDKVIGFGKACVEAAAEVQASNAQFEQTFTVGGENLTGTARKIINGVADSSGILATRLQDSGTKIYAFAKSSGASSAEAMDLMGTSLQAAADTAAYYDISLEDATETLQSFLKGNFANDAALGVSATEFTRNAAATELFGKKYNDLTEIQKQQTLLKMVTDSQKLSGAMGQAAREADGWENVTGNLKESWKQFQAVVGAPILSAVVPIIKNITSGLSDMGENVKSAQQWMLEHKTTVEILGVALGTVGATILAYNISLHASAIAAGIATAATSAFGAVMAFVTSPVTLVVAAIGALIAIGVLLYKNWDTIKEKALELFGKMQEVWGNIKTYISENVEEIKTAISEKFEAVKQTFSDIWNSITETVSTVWETIKNVVQVGIMVVGEILSAAFQIITLPFRFIWENCKDIIIDAWNAIKSAVSTALNAIKTTISNVWNAIVAVLSPILNTIKSTVTSIWNSIKSTITTMMNAIKSVISSVWNSIKSTVSSVLNSILSVVSSIWNSIKSTVSSIMNGIKSTISSAWNSVKSTVSNAINGVKSTVSSGMNSAKSTVSSVLDGIKEKFTSIFEKCKTIVTGAIDKIKGAFNFSWSLPPLKLPRISISGKFSLKPPSVPHFGIEWHKKAMDTPMIMTKPTIFDFNPATGMAKGGGEAGSEVVSGTTTLMNMIQSAVSDQNETLLYYIQKLIDILVTYFPQIIEAMDRDVILDSGALVGEMAVPMNQALGKLSGRKDRGR